MGETSVWAAILGGIVGGVISPILLAEYQTWRRERHWAAPRKTLLAKMLRHPHFEGRSLKRLTLVSGTTDDDCRSLLIALGARGMTMNDKSEGWRLPDHKVDMSKPLPDGDDQP